MCVHLHVFPLRLTRRGSTRHMGNMKHDLSSRTWGSTISEIKLTGLYSMRNFPWFFSVVTKVKNWYLFTKKLCLFTNLA